MIDDGVDVGPIGAESGHLVGIGRLACGGEELRHVEGLLLLREVAGVVHGERARGASVARHVHGEDIIASVGKVGHPTEVGVGDIEGDLGGSTRAVDEEGDLVGSRPGSEGDVGPDYFAHVDLRGLSGDGGNGGAHLDVVIDAKEIAVVSGGAACGEGQNHQKASCVEHVYLLVVPETV